ncbi:MAG: hypothetical protein HYY96_01290 [Candidatus Tectomicrobia bacterium]|nr:hypothetical protein [Candidatus Tectomicrobia bacterium]
MRIRHRGRSFLVPIPGTNHTISILDGDQEVPDDIGELLIRQGRVAPVRDEKGASREEKGEQHSSSPLSTLSSLGGSAAAPSAQSAQSVDRSASTDYADYTD